MSFVLDHSSYRFWGGRNRPNRMSVQREQQTLLSVLVHACDSHHDYNLDKTAFVFYAKLPPNLTVECKVNEKTGNDSIARLLQFYLSMNLFASTQSQA